LADIEEKLKFLLKEAKLQGFVGISQIKETAETAEEEYFLSQKLQNSGIEINHFLRTMARNYKTTSYLSKKERKFSLTTRIDESGESILLDSDNEKGLFERMTNARNKMLRFAFSSPETKKFVENLAKKVESGTVKISVVVNCEKDESEEKTEINKCVFLEAVKRLDNADKKQLVDLLFSMNFTEKTKSLIYNKFTKTPNYGNEIKNELYELEQIYSAAKREIIEANIRLVFSIAKEYSVVHKGILDISDIIQEGNIGLIDAVESFDFTKGNKFSSWAVWYIRRQIWTAVNSFKKIVYVPPKASTDLYKISLFEEKYKAQNGESPTIQQIAEEFDLKEKQVLSLLAADFGDINPNYEFAITSSDFYEDTDEFNDKSNNPFNILAASGLKKNIDELLSKVSEREREMIKLYFGLEEEKGRLNLAQIGEIYGISRERVRQIIEKSIENIKEMNANIIKEWK